MWILLLVALLFVSRYFENRNCSSSNNRQLYSESRSCRNKLRSNRSVFLAFSYRLKVSRGRKIIANISREVSNACDNVLNIVRDKIDYCNSVISDPFPCVSEIARGHLCIFHKSFSRTLHWKCDVSRRTLHRKCDMIRYIRIII